MVRTRYLFGNRCTGAGLGMYHAWAWKRAPVRMPQTHWARFVSPAGLSACDSWAGCFSFCLSLQELW